MPRAECPCFGRSSMSSRFALGPARLPAGNFPPAAIVGAAGFHLLPKCSLANNTPEGSAGNGAIWPSPRPIREAVNKSDSLSAQTQCVSMLSLMVGVLMASQEGRAEGLGLASHVLPPGLAICLAGPRGMQSSMGLCHQGF